MDFKTLLEQMNEANSVMQSRAVLMVNQSHTLRNWLYGFYIIEYEQNGNDYAEYGSRLLYRLADELKKKGIKGISYTNLTLFRKFYLYYPQMGVTIKTIAENNVGEKLLMRNLQPLAEDFKNSNRLPPELLLSKLSFTHFAELMSIDEPIQRLFYEIEAIKGNWTRRQLHRQMGSMLYERTGLSRNKEALLAQVEKGNAPTTMADIIRRSEERRVGKEC